MDLDLLGRCWREKPLAERLWPAWAYALLVAMCFACGVWAAVGVDGVPLTRSRFVAVLFLLFVPVHAWLAVLSRRVRGGR